MTRRELILAVSPYHLATAEPAAMAALLLADKVVTYRPAPAAVRERAGEEGRAELRDAVERSPRLLRLMERWRWTMPLWRAGVIVAGATGMECGGELRGVWERIAGERAEAGLSPLRGLMRPELFAEGEEAAHVDALCADMLKGGVDPGIGVLVAAGMDAASARAGWLGVRAGFEVGGGSVSQRAEAALGVRSFAVAVPVLLHAGGKRVLAAREALEPELSEVRRAMLACARAEEGAEARLAEAGETYTRAFDEQREDLVAGDDENGVRVQDGLVSLTGVWVPADAAIRSWLAAVATLSGGRMRREESAAGTGGARLLTLVVKRMRLKREGAGAMGNERGGRAGRES